MDGLYRITRDEGFTVLFKGVTVATIRAVVMTVAQLCVYDYFKIVMLEHKFKDNLSTHFTSSLAAVCRIIQ